LCAIEVLLNVALWVDHDCCSGGGVSNKVRSVRKAFQVKLFKYHHGVHSMGCLYYTLWGITCTQEAVMKIEQEILDGLMKRLARVEGQVRAVRTMIEQGRECRDVITQVSAASTALDQVGFRLLSAGLQQCLQDPKQAKRDGFDLEEVEKLFLKLA
jgi:DNA-binding FrmR family transcriptional regulator